MFKLSESKERSNTGGLLLALLWMSLLDLVGIVLELSCKGALRSRERKPADGWGWGIEWPRSPLNLSVLLAAFSAVAIYLLLWRSRPGYALRAVGHALVQRQRASIDNSTTISKAVGADRVSIRQRERAQGRRDIARNNDELIGTVAVDNEAARQHRGIDGDMAIDN